MKLTPPETLIGPNGPIAFPWVCPHCSRCYWLQPGVDIVAKRSNARPEEMEAEECRQAWYQEKDIAQNPGMRFAMGLEAWARKDSLKEDFGLTAKKWEESLQDAYEQGRRDQKEGKESTQDAFERGKRDQGEEPGRIVLQEQGSPASNLVTAPDQSGQAGFDSQAGTPS